MTDDNITLLVEDAYFTISARMLREKSDFFEAMLSGQYSETNKKIIQIPTVPAFAMEAICSFVNNGTIPDIQELKQLLELARCAMYLQMKSFLCSLNIEISKKITIHNWFIIYEYALSMDLTHTLCIARNFVLFHFKDVKSEITKIEDISSLVWYLSHRELNVDLEYNIFLTGVDWLIKKDKIDTNNILAILYCLDFWSLPLDQLRSINEHELVHKHEAINLILNTIFLYIKGNDKGDSTINGINKNDISQFKKDPHFEITYDILFHSSRRKFETNLIFCTEINEKLRLSIFSEKEKAINHIAYFKDDLILWGHSIVCWRGCYIISVCGQILHSKRANTRLDSARFKTTVDIYSHVTDSWTVISLLIEPRRHAGVAINSDSLYIVGGTGTFRKRLNSVWMYEIVKNQWHQLPSLPKNCSASKITVAAHTNYLYVYCNIFIFLNLQQSTWQEVDIIEPHETISFGSMVFDNNNLYFGCEPSNLVKCYNLETKKVVKKCNLPGCIVALCKKGSALFTLYEISGDETIKARLLKINLIDGEQTELYETETPWDYPNFPGKIDTATGFFPLTLYQQDDEHIVPECSKKWIS